jgi:RNA polymerase sigma-70 factor (ECF subfamily)
MPAPIDAEERRLLDALTTSQHPAAAAEALVRLMARYKRLAYAIAFEASRNRSLADDVFQETFVRMTLWLRARPGIEVRSFPRLLSAFVQRTALELGRQNQRLALTEDAAQSPIVDSIYARELLDALPELARGVLERTLLRGMSSKETAAEMKLTPENVRLIKHRAIRAIRQRQARDLEAIGRK